MKEYHISAYIETNIEPGDLHKLVTAAIESRSINVNDLHVEEVVEPIEGDLTDRESDAERNR